MKYLFFTCGMLISFLLNAQSFEKNFIDQNYIEVTGKSEMLVVPDLIYLHIMLKEEDEKNKVSVQTLEKRMMKALEEIGLDIEKDVSISDISSNFKNYILSRDDVVLSKQYQVVVRDGLTASKVYIGLEKEGISNISIAKLDHSNIIHLRKEVKIKAIQAAKEKATFLAEAIDQSTGKAIFIQEQNNYMAPYRTANMMMSRNAVDDETEFLDIDFEKIKLEYSIFCRFKLLD